MYCIKAGLLYSSIFPKNLTSNFPHLFSSQFENIFHWGLRWTAWHLIPSQLGFLVDCKNEQCPRQRMIKINSYSIRWKTTSWSRHANFISGFLSISKQTQAKFHYNTTTSPISKNLWTVYRFLPNFYLDFAWVCYKIGVRKVPFSKIP